MKKIIGVAILAAAAVFVLAALIHQGQKQENQDPQVETQQRSPCPTADTRSGSRAATARSPRWT